MNKEIKYTTDGKKVIVVGKLNSQETIVQEIFISNDVELPSGENFVVKSLHDAPAVSWKESKLKELEARFEKEQRDWNNKIEALRKRQKDIEGKLTAKLRYAGAVLENVDKDSFNTVVDFLTGNIKWIVVEPEYSTPQLVELDSAHGISEYSNGKLRLLSLFGKDDGKMTYGIGTYSDYSGGKKTIIPFRDYESALAKFKEIIITKDRVCEDYINLAEKYNFKLDEEKLKLFYQKQADSIKEQIEKYKKGQEDYEKKLAAIPKIVS